MKKQIFGVAVALLALPTICFSQTSPDGSKIAAPTNNTLTDASGAVWGFAGQDPAFPLDYYVTMNGQMIQAQGYPAGIFWSMSELLILNNGQVYATDDVYGGGDYQWNGATFTPIPSLPSGGPPPSITLNGASGGTTVTAGASMSVAVANGPGNRGDWMGVCNAGVPISSTQCDGAGYSWDFLNCTQTAPPAGLTSATCSLPAPLIAGNYYAVFFSNSTYSVLASAPFQVTSPSPSGAPTVVQSEDTQFPGSGTQCVWTVSQAIRTGDTVMGYVHSSNAAGNGYVEDSIEEYPSSVTDNAGNTYTLSAGVHWAPWPEDIGYWYLTNIQGNPNTFTFHFSGYPAPPICNAGFTEYSNAPGITIAGPSLVYGGTASISLSPPAPSLIWAFAADFGGGIGNDIDLTQPPSALHNSGYSVLIDNYQPAPGRAGNQGDDMAVWGSNALVPAAPLTLTWDAPYGSSCNYSSNGCPTLLMAASVMSQ